MENTTAAGWVLPPSRMGAGCGPSLELAWALPQQAQIYGHIFVRSDHEVGSDPWQLIPWRLLAMLWCYWSQQEDPHRFNQDQDLAWWEQTERLRQRALSIAQNNLPADGHKTVFTKKAKLILHSSRVRQPSFLCLPYKSRGAGICGTANI